MLKTIKNSVWNPLLYKEIEGYTVGKAIWYYVKLCLLIGLLALLVSALTMFEKGKIINELVDKLIASYPSDVVLQIEKGVISQSPEGAPIVLSMESFLGDASKNLKWSDDGIEYNNSTEKGDMRIDLTNLVVVDTSIEESPTVEQFKDADTLALITKKYIVVYDEDESISFNDVSKYPDFTLDKATFDKLVGYGRLIPYAIPFLLFFGGFFLSLMTLIGIFFLSVILFVVEALFKNKITFGNAFKTCVYASSVPLIIHVILMTNSINVPYLFSLMVLLIALINIKGKPKSEPIPVVPPTA